MSQVPTQSTPEVLNGNIHRGVFVGVDGVKPCVLLTETAENISFVLKLTRHCSLCGWCSAASNKVGGIQLQRRDCMNSSRWRSEGTLRFGVTALGDSATEG